MSYRTLATGVFAVLLTACTTTSYAQTPAPATAAPATSAPLALTMEEAIQRGLKANLNARLQDAEVTAAEGARWVALRDLLPTTSGHLSWTRQEINLAAFGFSVPGQPSIIGPFNVHDFRVAVSQPLVDLQALYAARAGSANLHAAEFTMRDTRELIGLAVRNLYLESVAAESRLKAAQAQVETAHALLTQATDLRTAGVAAGIDVLRAQVQSRTQEQRAIVAENEFQKNKLELARAIGLPLGQEFTLADQIPYEPLQTIPLDQAVTQALATRQDYKAAQERLRAAEASKKAALADNLPSFHLNADYGQIGSTPADTHSTFAVTGLVRIPLFDAATTRGHVLEADAQVQRRQAELEDYRARVELEVRSAYLDVRAADQQLQAAREAMTLANQELEQTRDRFAAGVSGSVEIVQSQESVARATENYISSLYAHNLAKATLAHAIGGSATQ